MIPGIRLVSINFASFALLIGKTESEISVRDTLGHTQCLLCVLGTVHFFTRWGGCWDLGGGSPPKNGVKGGGASQKKNGGKGGSREIF